MMRGRWIFLVSAAALGLLGPSAQRGQAGSWFGPCCYGADYAKQYPNRSHNLFGSAAGISCPTWHPWFRGRWRRRNCGIPCSVCTPAAAPIPAAPTTPPSLLPQTMPAMPHPLTPAPLPAGPANAENPF